MRRNRIRQPQHILIKPGQSVIGQTAYPGVQKYEADPTWLELRSAMIGTWKEKPEDNVLKLRTYLGWHIKEDSPNKVISRKDPKYRRVFGYLSNSAFNPLGPLDHPKIREFMIELKKIKI